MVKVSFGMLFECVTLSSKHMLQVRCSFVEIKPSMNITHRGTAPWASLRGLRRHRALTRPPWPTPQSRSSRRHHRGRRRRCCGRLRCRRRFSPRRRRRRGDDDDDDADARRGGGGGDEGPAQAAANDDGARGGAVAAPGRPFDSDKARGAESGRSQPRSKPNTAPMNLTLRGYHATEL